MGSHLFNDPLREDWPLFTTVDQARVLFVPGTKIMIAIGGWGDTAGFSAAALNDTTRKSFAGNIARMVSQTGADGKSIR